MYGTCSIILILLCMERKYGKTETNYRMVKGCQFMCLVIRKGNPDFRNGNYYYRNLGVDFGFFNNCS